MDRRPEEEVLNLLHKHNISVIARGPIAKGILSNQGLKKIPEKGYLNYSGEELQNIISVLSEKTNKERTLSQTAIRYSLAHLTVAVAIPGASRLEQLLANIETADTPPLTNEEINLIREFTQANRYEQHR